MMCDEQLTLKECTDAFKNLANNKSPAIDDFQQTFINCWNDFKTLPRCFFVHTQMSRG